MLDVFSPFISMTTNGKSSIRVDDAQVYWIEKKGETAVPRLVLKDQFDLYENGEFPTTGGWLLYRSAKFEGFSCYRISQVMFLRHDLKPT